jgi:peptidyl-prolyl cis-trans isomerase SurA
MRIFIFILLLSAAINVSAATVVEEIVAHVGNEIITKTDFDREQQRLHDELSRRYQGEELQQRYEEQRKALLEFMVTQKLLEQRAAELNLNVDEEITAAVQRLREENKIPDDQTLDAALKQEGSSLKELREDFRRRIIQQRILWNYVQGKVNITEDEIKTYYDQHKTEMMTQPKTKISRYALAGEEIPKDELKAEADRLLSELRSGKEINQSDYSHLKMDEAIEFTKTDIDPKIVAVLEATEVGSYTDPLEITSGWLILKVEERHEPEPIPFEEARTRIYNLLLQQRAEKYQKNFIEDLKKQNYVVINQPAS